MLLPDRECTSFRIYLNGELAGSAPFVLREDVGRTFPWMSHAARSGFHFRLQGPAARTIEAGRLDVIGVHRRGYPIARLGSAFQTETAGPTPPPELMKRVANTDDPRFFAIGGRKTYGEIIDAIHRHRELRSARRVLDWGCGCGRVTVHLLADPGVPEVFGCDIDPEAVAWCNRHLRAGAFSRIEPWPPTPYPDATFDVVIAHSVFTHLARDVQKAWLAEMRRIIVPGGLLLASTHGEFAARFTSPNPFGDPESPRRLVKNLKTMLARFRSAAGRPPDMIRDGTSDPALNGITPDGYYQSVFQTRAYTIREWSKYFDILEYVERGMGNFQDLVVMRRPA